MPSIFLTAQWRKLIMANYRVDPVVLQPFLPARTELDSYIRFYVRYKEGTEWKRGVVFISEIVPRPAITWVANTLFREHYTSLPMRHSENLAGELWQIGYSWKYRGRWNELSVEAATHPQSLTAGSKEEFITEHFWGYAAAGGGRTGEYQVAHPRWDVYGPGFSELATRAPESVFLAEGSAISVYTKRII
jgi:hypothetical protein